MLSQLEEVLSVKSVVCQNTELRVEDRPALRPGNGQVLLDVLRCGICGSDLHLRLHCDHMAGLMNRTGYDHFPSAADPIVFGHEFCGEVLEYGPKTSRKLKPGTRVCAFPLLRSGNDIDLIGLSARSPGAYAEQIVVEESLMSPVPNGLSAEMAALTEPLAVANHAVARSEIAKRDVAIVIGCGPVGLAVIAILKARRVRTIVAADFSPARRDLARRCGADVAIDPERESPYKDWQDYGFIGTAPALLELGLGTREKLGKLPIPWWQTWGVIEALGIEPKRPVIFECVGVPGILASIVDGAPFHSRVVVVGVCMVPDSIEPALAINKEIDLRFVLGYSPLEYRSTLHLIADGKVRCEPLITGTVGLEGVARAFDALRDPERHAKILIDPKRAGDEVGEIAIDPVVRSRAK